MKKNILFSTLFLLLLTISNLQAHTTGEVEQKCPLCQHEFKAIMDMSGTSFGMRLDLKKLGPIASPWRLAVCPKCHFVLFKDKLFDDEQKTCSTTVYSEEYKEFAKNRSSYFLAAKLMEALKSDPSSIAHTYLKASWQEEGDDKKYKEDLRLSLGYFEKFLQGEKKEDVEEYALAQLLAGELERRLGKFAEAGKRFESVNGKEGYLKAPLPKIITYQLKLIASKDSKPHTISEAMGPSWAKADSDITDFVKKFVLAKIGGKENELKKLYADKVMLLPGHEYLKEKYGFNKSGDRSQQLATTAEKIIRQDVKNSVARDKAKSEKIPELIRQSAFTSFTAKGKNDKGEAQDFYRVGRRSCSIPAEKGDLVVKIQLPQTRDFLLYVLRKSGESWKVVADYTD